jgi:hypothetical protein
MSRCCAVRDLPQAVPVGAVAGQIAAIPDIPGDV